MRVFNRLVLYLAVAFTLVNVTLALAGQKDISVYFVLNGLAYLIITVLYVYLNPRARNALRAVSGIVFAGFVAVVAMKVVEILR